MVNELLFEELIGKYPMRNKIIIKKEMMFIFFTEYNHFD
jgi:hypothetical protein